MSNYEDYETVSKCYDDDRTPEGADIIAGLLFIHGGKPLKVSQIFYTIKIYQRICQLITILLAYSIINPTFSGDSGIT